MTDFLTRLAARQRGDVATVSPRLPLRFAPVVEQPPDEPVAAVPGRERERPTLARTAPPPAPLVRTPDTVVASTPPAAPTPVPPAAPAVERSADAPPRRPEPAASPLRAPMPEPPADAVAARPPEPSDPPVADEHAVPATAAPPAPPIPRTLDPARHDDTPRAAATPAPLVAPHRHVAPPVEASPHLAELAPPVPTGPPTVTVTIGRLEVRAAPAPPAAERKASAPPTAPSLEEYLERRQARRR